MSARLLKQSGIVPESPLTTNQGLVCYDHRITSTTKSSGTSLVMPPLSSLTIPEEGRVLQYNPATADNLYSNMFNNTILATLLNLFLAMALVAPQLRVTATRGLDSSVSNRHKRNLPSKIHHRRAPANATHERTRRAISVHNVQEYTGSGDA